MLLHFTSDAAKIRRTLKLQWVWDSFFRGGSLYDVGCTRGAQDRARYRAAPPAAPAGACAKRRTKEMPQWEMDMHSPLKPNTVAENYSPQKAMRPNP